MSGANFLDVHKVYDFRVSFSFANQPNHCFFVIVERVSSERVSPAFFIWKMSPIILI